MSYALIVLLAVAENSLVMAQDDTCTRYGFDIDLPGASCADIHSKNPTSHGKSGYYVLKTDHLFFAYCDMELDCGGTKGGWMRIAGIDTTIGATCPNGWTNYTTYCTGGSTAGCYSAYFVTDSIRYSKVCGKVVGYQKGTTDAFYPSAYAYGKRNGYTPTTASRSLDGVYVDGISVTSGSPRKHVWTYAARVSNDGSYPQYNCPCAKYPGPDPPVYVGSHYYCDGGVDEPLWNGAECKPENSCCHDAGMPWFFRQFPVTITGDIEVRICHDQSFSDESILVQQVQLYAQ